MRSLFAFTILLNALLLFLVQPMIARMLLPYLGGSPSVWNTCMVFFQTALLAGYAYAHLTSSRLRPRVQIVLHLVLLLLAAGFLPFAIADSSVKALGGPLQPAMWLLVTLAAIAGPPFLVLSAGGSLLQQWFSRTDHALAHDPYFLYAASNAGSLAALLGYPLLVEPALRLQQQSRGWTAGYWLLAVLIALCARAGWNAVGTSAPPIECPPEPAADAPAPRKGSERWWWMLLAFAPSSLMLGATTYLTTDISPIPLLWVLPLAIYLLTFVLAFARRPARWLRVLVRMWLPIVALVVVFLLLVKAPLPVWLQIALHLLLLFLAAMHCHARLANARPPVARLTEFYLWISIGGALGGAFNSLLAPLLFAGIAEYPLAIVLALLLRPRPRPPLNTPGSRRLDVAWPMLIGALTAALALGLPRTGLRSTQAIVLALALPLLLSFVFVARPVRFALAMGAVMLGSLLLQDLYFGRTLRVERNFYGSLRVADDREGRFRAIFHGNTAHGKQFLIAGRQCEPLSYYHRRGPLGQAIEAFAAAPASAAYAVIGLGTGAMACYAQPGQRWTFYEINPAVPAVAGDSRYFSYLQQCAKAPVETVLGDARLRLQRAPDQHFGLIVLDAFNSDAIPTHLLTLEAVKLYLAKLAPGGRLAFHLSSKYVDLRPVIGDLAARLDLVCLVNDELKSDPAEGLDPALWAALARRADELGALRNDSRWRRLEGRTNARVWTDDFSNVLGVIRWR